MPFFRVSLRDAKTIGEALSFVKSKIEEYRTEKKTAVDKAHHDVIDKEIEKVVQRIEDIKAFLKEKAGSITPMDSKNHEVVMDTIRSALELYLRDTMEARAKSGLAVFDAKIEEIRRITSQEGFKDGRTDLYDQYYEAPIPVQEGKKIEVFLSYSTVDKVLAGKMANLLTERGIDVFLAHEHIEVSEE